MMDKRINIKIIKIPKHFNTTAKVLNKNKPNSQKIKALFTLVGSELSEDIM